MIEKSVLMTKAQETALDQGILIAQDKLIKSLKKDIEHLEKMVSLQEEIIKILKEQQKGH
jgi:hypothetical protein